MPPLSKSECCAFCFKFMDGRDNQGDCDQRKFIAAVQKYMKVKVTVGANAEESGRVIPKIKGCEDCNKVIESFCNLHDVFKNVEQEMERRIEMLIRLMISADEVPPKKENFRMWCNRKFGESGGWESLTIFRRDLIRKGTIHLSKNFPKVKIEPIETEKSMEEQEENEIPSVASLTDETMLSTEHSDAELDNHYETEARTDDENSRRVSARIRAGIKCSFCQLTFYSASVLQAHVKSSHGGSQERTNVEEESDCEMDTHNSDDGVSDYGIAEEWKNVSVAPASSRGLNPKPKTKVGVAKKKVKVRVQISEHKEDRTSSDKEEEESSPRTQISQLKKKRISNLQKNIIDDPNKVSCDLCPRRFSKQKLLNRHVILAHSRHSNLTLEEMRQVKLTEDGITINDVIGSKQNAKFFCILKPCKETFAKKEDYEEHLKLHGDFQCEFCEVRKTFAPELALHEWKSHGMVNTNAGLSEDDMESVNAPRNQFSCCRCSYKTHMELQYIEHHLEQHLMVPYKTIKCPICQKTFYRKSERIRNLVSSIYFHHVTNHLITNSSEGVPQKTYTCDECPAYFLTGLHLRFHKRELHAHPDGIYKCMECDKRYKNRDSLGWHRKSKHGVTSENFQFACDIGRCTDKFETNEDLDSHKSLRHTDIIPKLVCSVCGAVIFGKGPLTRHMKTHDEQHQAKIKARQKTYICEHCGKVLQTSQSLKTHYDRHNPEGWKFSCPICSKKCINKWRLIEHQRTHTKEKRFVCPVCDHPYAHRHRWKEHMVKKHGYQFKDVRRK